MHVYVSVKQSSGCSTEMGDDTGHFQAKTLGLSIPHLMCQRTEETYTTPGATTAHLLTYTVLIATFQTKVV